MALHDYCRYNHTALPCDTVTSLTALYQCDSYHLSITSDMAVNPGTLCSLERAPVVRYHYTIMLRILCGAHERWVFFPSSRLNRLKALQCPQFSVPLLYHSMLSLCEMIAHNHLTSCNHSADNRQLVSCAN